MNILFLTHRIPYPPFKGDKLRAFNIIRYLSKRHNIHLLCVTHNKREMSYKKDLLEFCKSVEIAYIDLPLRKVLSPFYIIRGLPLTLPFFYSGRLYRLVKTKSQSMDIVFIFSSSMAQYALNLRIPKIIDLIDVDSDKWRQYAEYSKIPMRFIYKREAGLLERYEDIIIKNVDFSIAVSQEEIRLFKTRHPDGRIYVVSNGVDLDYFKPINTQPQKDIIAFCGEMDYFANVYSVLSFYKEIFPLIKKAVPDVKFYIVGRNPSRKILALRKEPDVIVTGQVPDVRPFLSMAKVCAIPIKIGRGIQNKVLEAMAMGKAVVTTSIAVQGINVIDGKELFVCDKHSDFADRVIELLRDTKLREEIGRSARKAVEQRYNWDENLRVLDNLIASTYEHSPGEGKDLAIGYSPPKRLWYGKFFP